VSEIIHALLAHPEPAVRWRLRTEVLEEPADSAPLRRLRAEIPGSPVVRQLLAGRAADGRLTGPSVYGKWQGAHWVLAALADLGYPPGDESLYPMRDQVLDTWLNPNFFHEFAVEKKDASYRGRGVPVMQGRYRRCGSQQGNALRFLTVLGLCPPGEPAGDRLAALVERLLYWQWPDGGWNCDRRPEAAMSSVAETLLPMRGLAAYAAATGDKDARAGAERAAEVLLERQVAYRRTTGELIKAEVGQLHWPLYWHYDVLGGLKGLAEVGALADPRCARALDLLAAKRLPDGGWPAEKRYYRTSPELALGNDNVDWGGTAKRRSNPWVTLDGLLVLKTAVTAPR
jgi:hypothetical protein